MKIVKSSVFAALMFGVVGCSEQSLEVIVNNLKPALSEHCDLVLDITDDMSQSSPQNQMHKAFSGLKDIFNGQNLVKAL